MGDITPTLQQYLNLFEELLQAPVYALPQIDKEAQLKPIIELLHNHHQFHCQEYNNITHQFDGPAKALDDLPFLAVRLFKQLKLSSIASQEVFKVLQSSGTTSQTPATLFLDRATSARQSKVLVKIMQQSIGKQRLPMLIIDSPAVLDKKNQYSARGAGIQGLAFFGRDLTYALDENMQPNWPVIEAFVERYGKQPVLIFGFTFMVWCYFLQGLMERGKALSLPQGILLHSGGWKKLEDQKVDNEQFKKTLDNLCGISKCYNFYGMAEQVGSVFVECEDGHLHCPVFADVITRDPYSLKICGIGQQGLVQSISALPTSYPGHSILTEDLGTILGIDDCTCGRKGKYFSIQGRLPKTEIRGCSDTHNAS